ncbi:cysteine desulfurase [Patescibacteria group bacterium]
MKNQTPIDVTAIRKDFPQLKRKINRKPIVYLDSTATSLKPQQVLDKMNEYYTDYCANIFRGIYSLSEEATAEYEAVREKIATFINAPDSNEIIFTRNTTESLNIVLYSWAKTFVKKGDEMVTTIMEHHSNFVPWQQWALEHEAKLHVWNVDKDGQLDLNQLETLVTKKTKLFAITSASNVLGTVNPIASIVKKVKRINPDCIIVVDSAQSAPHVPIDVQAWNADFVALSSHKMLGPTGIGVLWGKMDRLEEMTPFLYGGEMIREVAVEYTKYNEIPHKFEAGTPHIGGVIGFGAAIDYLQKLGMQNVREHEIDITSYAMEKLGNIDGLTMYGPKKAEKRGGVISFTMKDAHPHDIAQILNEDNICIRSGSHCAMPLHGKLDAIATARASFYIYTTRGEIDLLVEGLIKVKKMFS